jgi:hypothetical protein
MLEHCWEASRMQKMQQTYVLGLPWELETICRILPKRVMRPDNLNRNAGSDTQGYWAFTRTDCWLCELSWEVCIQKCIEASGSVLAAGEPCWVSLGMQNPGPTKPDQRASLNYLPDGASSMQKVQPGLEAKLVRQPHLLEKIGWAVQRVWVGDLKLKTKTKSGKQ